MSIHLSGLCDDLGTATEFMVGRVDNHTRCGQVDNVTCCGRVDNDACCGQVDNDIRCGQVDNITRCGQVDNVTCCGQIDNVTRCGRVDNDTYCNNKRCNKYMICFLFEPCKFLSFIVERFGLIVFFLKSICCFLCQQQNKCVLCVTMCSVHFFFLSD